MYLARLMEDLWIGSILFIIEVKRKHESARQTGSASGWRVPTYQLFRLRKMWRYDSYFVQSSIIVKNEHSRLYFEIIILRYRPKAFVFSFLNLGPIGLSLVPVQIWFSRNFFKKCMGWTNFLVHYRNTGMS